jgi:very-short-patch-repair endonuclease
MRGVSYRRSRSLSETDVVVRHGVRCLGPTKLIIDMAGRWKFTEAERLLDAGLRNRLTTVAELAARHESLPRPGRRGTRVMDGLLAQRMDGQHRTANELEAAVRRVLVAARLPEPVRQHNVAFGTRSRYLDLAYPELRIAIEIDGYRHHSVRTDWVSDQIRNNELVAAGWRILRATAEVRANPDLFIRQVRDLIDVAA